MAPPACDFLAGRLYGAYSLLESAMVLLDSRGDPLAEDVRDVLDKVWLRLNDKQIAALDDRPETPGPGKGE